MQDDLVVPVFTKGVSTPDRPDGSVRSGTKIATFAPFSAGAVCFHTCTVSNDPKQRLVLACGGAAPRNTK